MLGKRHMSLSFGCVRPGDSAVRKIDDTVLRGQLGMNIPLTRNLDATIAATHVELEGDDGAIHVKEEAQGYFAGVNCHFLPGQRIDPFVMLRLGRVFAETDRSLGGGESSSTRNEPAYVAGVGIEVTVSDNASLRATIEYDDIDEVNDEVAALGGSYWFTESFVSSVVIGYGFDDGDFWYSGGAGFTF